MADAFGDDLFSAFDEDSSSSRPVPTTSTADDDDKNETLENDSSKRLVIYTAQSESELKKEKIIRL